MKEIIKGGEILFASPSLEGTYFENAIILIIDKNVDGLFGVILNRASNMPVSEIFSIKLDIPITSRLIYIGGPVDDDMLLTLTIHDNDSQWRDGTLVSEQVELGGQWKDIDEIMMTDSKNVYLYLGYSGWQEDQLLEELDEGSWTLYHGINTREILKDWYNPIAIERQEIDNYLKEKCKSFFPA